MAGLAAALPAALHTTLELMPCPSIIVNLRRCWACPAGPPALPALLGPLLLRSHHGRRPDRAGQGRWRRRVRRWPRWGGRGTCRGPPLPAVEGSAAAMEPGDGGLGAAEQRQRQRACLLQELELYHVPQVSQSVNQYSAVVLFFDRSTNECNACVP